MACSRLENSVDPDQLASQKLADQDLHYFPNRKILWFKPGRGELVFKILDLDLFFLSFSA